ncbi:hypothetical protein F4804DRAFT_173172 [Jackrogersella minutella]|nr:hypothetical protein F4804DRAFT_173172 [Jackrogersella minutella]
MSNERAHAVTRSRRRRGLRSRRRQPTQANTAIIPATDQMEHYTASALPRHSPQIQGPSTLERDETSPNEHSPRSIQLPQLEKSDTSSVLHRRNNSERLGYDTHPPDSPFSDQQIINHPRSGDPNLDGDSHINHISPNQAEKEPPVSTHGRLGQCLAQQEVDGNFSLESWMFQSLHDGPLCVIPELSNPSDFQGPHLGSWGSYDLGSDAGATGGGTPEEHRD